MSFLDLYTIKKYIKNINHISLDGINILHLPQLKSYLKRIDISYLVENTNILILSDIVKKDIVEEIIKINHIFNNITVASRPYIIKVSPKSDI